jgi:hypothetical protein
MIKKITFMADGQLIDEARRRASREHTTLAAAFRRWLREFAGTSDRVSKYRELMASLDYVRPGRHLSRNELNKR